MTAEAMPARDPRALVEDLEFLDEQRVGATEAAARTGFPSAQAMEKWLERHDAWDLWLSMKHRDPVGVHVRKAQTKVCAECREDKPLTEFYQDKGRVRSLCVPCHNRTYAKKPTPSRMVRTRARNRAYVHLARAHPDEFEALMAFELEKAAAEHAGIAAAAGGAADAATARLKSGPRRAGETVIDRLAVARCVRCHEYHDADHVCPTCPPNDHDGTR